MILLISLYPETKYLAMKTLKIKGTHEKIQEQMKIQTEMSLPKIYKLLPKKTKKEKIQTIPCKKFCIVY